MQHQRQAVTKGVRPMGSDEIDEIVKSVSRTGTMTQKQLDFIQKMIDHLGTPVYEKDEPKKQTAAQLRKKYPALKDAYDQYRVVLKLVQGEETK